MSHPMRATALLALALSAVCLRPFAARAQAAAPTSAAPGSRVAVGIAGGASAPTGVTGDLHDAGWRVAGLLAWIFPASAFSVQADIAYASLRGKNIRVGSTSVHATGRSLFSIGGDLVWTDRPRAPASGRMIPYLLGGAGFYRTTGSRTGTSPLGSESLDESSATLGFDLGGGVMYRLSAVTFFAEARFENVFNGTLDDQGVRTSAHYVPVSIGLRFGAP